MSVPDEFSLNVPIENSREVLLDNAKPLVVRHDALDTNHYSVPWRLIGARVRVEVTAGVVCIFHAGVEVARHDERRGRRERVLDPAHLVGVIANDRGSPVTIRGGTAEVGELLRPLAEYEQIAGGGW